MKLFVTFTILLFTLGVYGYFVNISSTKGYFLRNEMKNLEDAKFEQSVVQIEILKKERQLWDDTNKDEIWNQKKIHIENKVVYLDYNSKQLFTKN